MKRRGKKKKEEEEKGNARNSMGSNEELMVCDSQQCPLDNSHQL